MTDQIFVTCLQIWTRPILPKNNNSNSFAVAYVSLRTDGAPYRIQFTLSDIGLTNSVGYVNFVRDTREIT